MEAKMKIYDGYLITEYVKPEDWPEPAEIFISLDIQNRLGPQTWLVAIMGNGTCQDDTVQKALFWEFGDAFLFADRMEKGIEWITNKEQIKEVISKIEDAAGVIDGDWADPRLDCQRIFDACDKLTTLLL